MFLAHLATIMSNLSDNLQGCKLVVLRLLTRLSYNYKVVHKVVGCLQGCHIIIAKGSFTSHRLFIIKTLLLNSKKSNLTVQSCLSTCVCRYRSIYSVPQEVRRV